MLSNVLFVSKDDVHLFSVNVIMYLNDCFVGCTEFLIWGVHAQPVEIGVNVGSEEYMHSQ